MAKTVNSAFTEFNRDYVNLDSDETKTARSSRDWLYTQLNNFPSNDVTFPFKYEEKHIKFGSFSRNTKTRELDDIDLIFCLGGNNATYSQSSIKPDEYYIHTQNASDRLKNLSDDGKLNSKKVVNKVVSSLSNISQYKSAEIHRRQEAATLNLTSYAWTFDIVPAFYTTSGFYLIPDGSGNWKAANPGLDHEYILSLNKKYNSSVHQLVRTLKYWNKRAKMPTISSYLFENFVLNFVESKTELSPHIDINIINFWNYLKSAVFNNVNDPKKICSNLNDLSLDDKRKISEKANDAYHKGYEAYRLETEDQNQEASINKWREIFGSDYPQFN
ncbi:SMODS domain-containing nucleotidyltransferase [Flavobacterium salmonis]|uniref:Nucleotidyltransferase n=1 Tax=Flavobacterium salmonis TaxID=2654844 RepID=A0A6V6Z7Q3_9FLAO|nr:nucleotidyltransferase [Flavobacterium salmonis]CAD0007817.1 hypothetical protein FLAT13_04051 [Flavobacterium salmonis]